jgi:hypothetical protein
MPAVATAAAKIMTGASSGLRPVPRRRLTARRADGRRSCARVVKVCSLRANRADYATSASPQRWNAHLPFVKDWLVPAAFVCNRWPRVLR